MDNYINQKLDMQQNILAGGIKMKDRNLLTTLLFGLSNKCTNFFDQLNGNCMHDLYLFKSKLHTSAAGKENLATNARNELATEKVYYVNNWKQDWLISRLLFNNHIFLAMIKRTLCARRWAGSSDPQGDG
jgi:hypothetical protein